MRCPAQTPGSSARRPSPAPPASPDPSSAANGDLDLASLRLHGTQAPLWTRLEGTLAKGKGLLGDDPALERLMREEDAVAAVPYVPQRLVHGACCRGLSSWYGGEAIPARASYEQVCMEDHRVSRTQRWSRRWGARARRRSTAWRVCAC